MSLRTKTITGLKWSFTDNAVNQIIQFSVGIVLARLLSPSEYGIIGMMMVFISVSKAFVDSGFTEALIRKQNCTDADYNTMFYSNIAMGLITFTILFFASGAISSFYNIPELKLLGKIMALNLIINSFGFVETAMLVKKMNFRLQTKISLIATVSSGFVAILLAYLGFGYWSLVVKTIMENLVRVSLLHLLQSWRPRIQYSIDSCKELLSFGIRIMAAGIIGVLFENLYKLVIGKYFSAKELGLYTRAEQFANLPSKNLELTAQRVTYPVLSSIAGDDAKLKAGYKKIIKLSFFITSTLMLFLMTTSREVVLIMVGDKWSSMIPYLQIMCISGTLYPLQSLTLNILKVKNRPDLYLRLEIIKKILVIPIVVIGIYFGLVVLLWGMVFNVLVAYLLNTIWSAKLIDYSTGEQLKDILPTIIYNAIMVGIVFLSGLYLSLPLILSFTITFIIAIGYIVLTGYAFKRPEFLEVKGILFDQIRCYLNMRKIKAS